MDGLAILDELSNEELTPLVKLIVDKGGITEELSLSPEYKKYFPDHHKYLNRIKDEIIAFGKNSFRGWVDYESVVRTVCKKRNVSIGNGSLLDMESNLLGDAAADEINKMTPEDRLALLQSIDDKETLRNYSGKVKSATLSAIFRAGGFTSYKYSVIGANAIAKYITGSGLSFAANATLTKGLSFLTGPIGTILGVAWTIYDFAGPAYRVICPAVVYIAFMRRIHRGS